MEEKVGVLQAAEIKLSERPNAKHFLPLEKIFFGRKNKRDLRLGQKRFIVPITSHFQLREDIDLISAWSL